LYHNSGYSKSTKTGIPWSLIYSENFDTRQQAMNREAELKKYKSRVMIEKIIGKHLNLKLKDTLLGIRKIGNHFFI